LDDPTRTRDSGSGGVPLPLVLEYGQGDLSDGVGLLLHDAHPGRAIGVAGAGALAVAPPLPPPSNGGGCSLGCHSFLSGVITAASMFLSGQFSPVPSFFGLPFSMPILPTKVMPSNCLRLTVRAARACGETSSGLSPSAESRMALSVPRLISADLAGPSGGPRRDQRSKALRPLD